MSDSEVGPVVHPTLVALAPRLAARRATDAFSCTRTLGIYPDDLPPLGARRFEVAGDPRVKSGYLWGDDGPTALLVHGWASDSSSMQGLVPPLRQLGVRVAAFDAPGHGVSEGSQATMTEFTRSVGAVLDAIGGADVVVAHSLGCIAAVGAYADGAHPQPTSMVLVAPTCTLSGVLERWAKEKPRMARPLVDSIYRELSRRNGVPVSHWDITALSKGLESRALVVHDPDDPVVPFSDAETVARCLPDARLETAQGHGHMAILASARLKTLLSEFVDDGRAVVKEGFAP